MRKVKFGMKYRKLGKTELKVSEVAVGCSGYWGNKNFSEKKAESIILTAFEHGVNFLDTGHNYCNYNAEPRLGKTIKKILLDHDRSKIILSSKAGTITPPSTLVSKRNKIVKDFSADHIEKSCLESIQNLNCEYLDIFQLHGITESQVSPQLIERLSTMREKGLFRYLGVNTHSESDMRYIAMYPEIFDMVLIDYNLLQLDREPVIKELDNAGVGVVAGTVLAQGHLIPGKIGGIKSIADIWYLARALMKPSSRRLSKNSVKMREALLKSNNMTAVQAAFSYVLSNKAISSCVFGTTKIDNLLEVIAATEKTLDSECVSLIKDTFSQIPQKVSM